MNCEGAHWTTQAGYGNKKKMAGAEKVLLQKDVFFADALWNKCR